MTPFGSRPTRSLTSWWWSTLALAGLLVGVMAFISDPSRDGSERPASRLLLELPDEIWGIASVAGSLAIMLWFGFLIALARRHQKKSEKGRPLWGVLVFSIIVTGVALWHRDLPQGLLLRPTDQYALIEEQKTEQPNMDGPAISLPLFTGVIGALLVGAAVASLGIACLVIFGDRLAEWWGRTRTERHPLAAVVDESLDDLGGEADARLAIIRCYRRFEVVLASLRFPRAPWQTPLEFMREALARLPVPPVAVERLTRLFERARFSNEALSPDDRDVAWHSLIEIRQRLEAEEPDGRPR
jgi:cbb3-type cytochrome oxidase subunit 3